MSDIRYWDKTAIADRYPRLIYCLKRQFILCDSEAESCIQDHQRNLTYSCEAISWCGRTTQQAIASAVASRHV